MSKRKGKREMFVVVMDGFGPQKYFDTKAAADSYERYCRANYLGTFEVKRCHEDFPLRFDRAIMAVERPSGRER
jgi:hypothetical protein